ncbi:MAG TPA: rod shape-determining protein [Acidimicrobiales bacterium]|nr:rod shape-determining protein [Acidimicrobiales bacterium]
MATDVALDVGTGWTRLASADEGLLFNEPTIVAIDTRSGEVVELGFGALDLVARTSRHVIAFRPLSQGATVDFDVTARLLSGLFDRAGISKISRVRALMSVPSLATPIERRALRQAAIQAGAREVSLLEAPLAAAIGLGLPVQDPVGSAVTVLGAGASEAALLSLGGIVTSATRRHGGVDLDAAIASLLRQRHGVVVSPAVTEALKVNLGSARGLTRGLTEEVVARTVSRGEPVRLTVGADLVNVALHDVVASTVRMVQDSLADAPPDLSQDVSARGLTLVGGLSRLGDLADLISTNTGVEIRVADDPELVVIRGLQLCLEEMSSLHPLFRDADL